MTTSDKRNRVEWSAGSVERENRETMLSQAGLVVWLTGLSGSGKSTLANGLEERLHQSNVLTYRLDGDNVRHGLNSDLGFSPLDREENVRRLGEVAALFADAGVVVLVACISPYAKGREAARQASGPKRFLEVFVRATVEQCEARDPKGLYSLARTGEIEEFTGVSAPYEVPKSPALALDTAKHSVSECVSQLYDVVQLAIDRIK